jgi:hypothetical protein
MHLAQLTEGGTAWWPEGIDASPFRDDVFRSEQPAMREHSRKM